MMVDKGQRLLLLHGAEAVAVGLLAAGKLKARHLRLHPVSVLAVQRGRGCRCRHLVELGVEEELARVLGVDGRVVGGSAAADKEIRREELAVGAGHLEGGGPAETAVRRRRTVARRDGRRGRGDADGEFRQGPEASLGMQQVGLHHLMVDGKELLCSIAECRSII